MPSPTSVCAFTSICEEDRSVTLFRQRIEDWEPKDVGLAYIDGDHTYEGTRAQIAKSLDCWPSAILITTPTTAAGDWKSSAPPSKNLDRGKNVLNG